MSLLLTSSVTASQAGGPPPSAAILQDLRGFREMGSVLYVAAHPDDENTQLITYLARGRHYRTAYLSVTRGDGGQNVLGPEFGEELGWIRTQELLAARRLDGGRQFFTRAIDFGFSKDAKETLRIWDRTQVVGDIVRVMRTFRPDVVVTRFSPQGGGGHGHHTSSAILAVEAFNLAGDAKAYPEQLGILKPWQPKRIFLNGFAGFGRGAEPPTNSGALRLESGGEDPVSGESFGDIAGRSRSMHKSQGFGDFSGFGGGRGGRPETFQLLAGDRAEKDILDGVDTTWGRVPGGGDIGEMADDVIGKFDSSDPVASVPALLKIRSALAKLPADIVLDEKRRQLDHILQACLGLEVSTTVPEAEVVAGETLKLRHTAILKSEIPARWIGVRYPSIGSSISNTVALRPGEVSFRDSSQKLPAGTPLSQPYWLRLEPTTGMYRVEDPSLIGRPENPPVFPVELVFEVEGQTLIIPDEPVQLNANSAKGETRRRLEVIPPVSLHLLSEVRLFAPASTRPVEVEVTSARPTSTGTLQLDAPAGWHVTPSAQPFRLAAVGAKARFTFNVTAPAEAANAALTARAVINETSFDNQRIEIRYRHIPTLLLQPPAQVKAVSLELAIRGHKIGYLPGAGDSVAEGLAEMGYTVTQLTGSQLTGENLQGLDAVVIGIRAFNVRTNLATSLPALFAFVEAGGNVIVQYNRPNGLRSEKLAPYELQISSDRVVDETAPMTFLVPEHPALNTPNKITSTDFDGWVQERGLYFPDRWDEHFKPILACNDPGESPKKGGLLVAQYGKGYFVYTGLAWFRQLPAAVPGAYRLFANLVSLGKP